MLKQIKLLAKTTLTDLLQTLFLDQATDITNALPAGPVLIIAPHPDDETLGCGGITALLKARGQAVRAIIVTDGGNADMPDSVSRQSLATTRRKESIAAAQILGLSTDDLVFLNHQDGQTTGHIEQIAEDIASQIWLYTPALILTPHGIDAHPDHRAVADAVQRLCDAKKITCPVLEYPMWFWPKGGLRHLFRPVLRQTHRKVAVSPYLKLKQAAIDAHQCQRSEANWSSLVLYHIAERLRPYELFFEKRNTPEK